MWIVTGDSFTQRGQSGLQRVTVLLFLNYAYGFAANYVGGGQIRFAEAEADVARFRPVGDLANRALFNPAQKWWWLEWLQKLSSHLLVSLMPKRLHGYTYLIQHGLKFLSNFDKRNLISLASYLGDNGASTKKTR